MKDNLFVKLILADRAYYNNGTSALTDSVYDTLREHLKNKYPNHPYFNRIGANISMKSQKIELPFILGSLDKKKKDSIVDWCNGKVVTISAKADGLSVYAEYVRNHFQCAITRGNGFVGQNITNKLVPIAPEPIHNAIFSGRFRGEIVMPKAVDYKLLGFSSRRNAAAGIIGRDDFTNIECLRVVFYEEICEHEHEHFEELNYIKTIFPENSIPFTVIDFSKERADVDFFDSLLNLWKNDVDYDVDGLVITENKNYIRENVKLPKNKICFKGENVALETTVNNIVFQVGRTGRLVPVVEFDSIELDGANITRATAHNMDFIENTKLNIGSTVFIKRSNEVIPYIDAVINEDPETKGFSIEFCPSCGEKIHKIGVDIKCLNVNCPDMIIQQTEYFLKTVGVENFTETTLRNLGIQSIGDVLTLTENDIFGREGFGDKKVKQIMDSISWMLNGNIDLATFLAALGLPALGLKNTKKLVDIAKGNTAKDKMYYLTREIKESDIFNIEGFGDVLVQNFKNSEIQIEDMFDLFDAFGFKFKEQIINKTKDSKYTGKTFVMTGSGNKSRNDYVEDIISIGGIIGSGVNKKTDYLVIADVNSASSKAKKAREMNVEMISYETLEEMINE